MRDLAGSSLGAPATVPVPFEFPLNRVAMPVWLSPARSETYQVLIAPPAQRRPSVAVAADAGAPALPESHRRLPERAEGQVSTDRNEHCSAADPKLG